MLRLAAQTLPLPATAEVIEGVLDAVRDTQADLVVVFARQRSYLGEVFHRSVTARLVATCPVPMLILPTTLATTPTTLAAAPATMVQYANAVIQGLRPAS